MSDDIDLDDLLGMTLSPVKSTGNEEKVVKNNEGPQSPGTTDFSDFLDWLDGDNKDVSTTQAVTIDSSNKTEAASNILSEFSESNSSSVVDNFMEELYGDVTANVSNDVVNSSIQPINSNSSNYIFEEEIIKPRDYVNDITTILRSSFPDLIQLKQYIYELGYIPDHLRCDIWNMLLSGSTNEDYNALAFDYTQNNHNANDKLVYDTKLFVSSTALNISNIESDIINIIMLYCLRKNKSYQPLLLNSIVPLIVTSKESVNRGSLSSCYYSLIDNFIPFGKLDVISSELAQDTVHSWLRLLVLYHSPNVAQHLDRLFPGWERPAKYNIASIDVNKIVPVLESTANYDKLDRDLGLDAIEDPIGWTITSETSASLTDDTVVNDDIDGLIANNWISGFFVNSIPNDLVANIYDLAILEEEKYFGVYMIATLLEIYSDIILNMNKEQICIWFQSVYSGKIEWFKISTNSITRDLFTNQKSDQNDWKVFLSGWLQATVALRKSTPLGFRKALLETDDWSVDTVATNKAAITRLLNSSNEENNEDSSTNSTTNVRHSNEPVYSIEDKDDDSNDDVSPLTASNEKGTILQQYFSIRKEIKQEYINNNFHDKSNPYEKKWQQDSKIDGNILNIWSVTDEVVPCIISTRRRANTTLSITKYFELGVENMRSHHDSKLFFPVSNIEEPFYFGIDCRSTHEKQLGIFPKTFSLDPTLLSDSDEVSKILETLEPLASSVHLCIIGAGEDYYKWKEQISNNTKTLWQGLRLNKASNSSTGSLTSKQEDSNLNSVAVFFMKKAFKHVSVLDGGFVAAAKYLYETQSHSGLISNLVDCDINTLQSVLGIQVSHIGTAIASNPNSGSTDTSANSKPVTMNSFLTSFSTVTSGLLKPGIVPTANQRSEPSAVDQSSNDSTTKINTKELFSGFSKSISMFGATSLETIKKGVSSITTNTVTQTAEKDNVANNKKDSDGFVLVNKKNLSVVDTQAAFVIDDDDDEDEDDNDDNKEKERPIFKDTHGVSVRRTESEKQQALILHRLAGIRKGDNITISKEFLPGAILFPCYKLKSIVETKSVSEDTVDLLDGLSNENLSKSVDNNDVLVKSESSSTVNEEKKITVQVHRYLVVTKERFMVIDSNGKGVGSDAVVKSNHHLTELVKMTFRKKDPELVTLFLQNGEDLKSHQYRVPKKQDFLNVLQLIKSLFLSHNPASQLKVVNLFANKNYISKATKISDMAMVVYNQNQGKEIFQGNKYGQQISQNHTKKYAGIRNQGATCYLNSVLQTLFMTPEFRHAIFKWRYDINKDGQIVNCIPYQLQKLFGYLQLNVDNLGDTVGLTTSFGWTGSDVFQQQDAQELFRVLFDALEYTFKGTTMENVIDTIFAGEMVDYIRCIDVDHETERIDKFLDFSLAIIPFGKSIALKSLEECIEMYLQPEILDKENQYYAEPFNKKVDAIKGIKICKLPLILTIQLKRFVFDFSGDNVIQKKINDVISFPMVLDMNKYVSNKKKPSNSKLNENSDNPIDQDIEIGEEEEKNEKNDEFEDFLQEQILLLRKNRKKEINKNANESDILYEEDIDTDQNDDDNTTILTDTEFDNEIPDLVDCFGNKSPDQIIEEKIKKENEFYLTKGGSKEDLFNLVKERGEWIYELYGVLIHSGAIAGGHYYAYIKDIDSKQWYNFNDSNVSEISESQVVDAWGKAIHHSANNISMDWSNMYSNMNSNQRSVTTYSGSNAYMLMYRKVILEENIPNSPQTISLVEEPKEIDTSSESSNGVSIFPSNEIIPEYIKALVQQEIELQNIRILEEEERRKKLVLSIEIKNVMKYIQVKTTTTLLELLQHIWDEYYIYNEKEFDDLRSSNDYIPMQLDRIRIRTFINQQGLRQASYDSLEVYDKTLQELHFNGYNSYAVELRSIDEEWLKYYNSGINLFVQVYNPIENNFYDHFQISLPIEAKVKDLKEMIHSVFTKGTRKYISYPVSSIRLLKLNKAYNSFMTNMKPIEILSDDNAGLWNSHRLQFHDKIYVEEIIEIDGNRKEEIIKTIDDYDLCQPEEKHYMILSPCYLLLHQKLFTISIFYSIPLQYHEKHNNNLCCNVMKVDSRWSINKLREVLANEINKDLDPNDTTKPFVDKSRLRIHLHYAENNDIRTNNRLSLENICDGAKLFLSIGFIAPLNHHQIKFKLYTPLHDGLLRDQSICILNYKEEDPLIDITPDNSKESKAESKVDKPIKSKKKSHTKAVYGRYSSDGYEGSGSSDEGEWEDENSTFVTNTNFEITSELTPINKSYQIENTSSNLNFEIPDSTNVNAIPLLNVEKAENSNIDEQENSPTVPINVNSTAIATAVPIEPSNFGALSATSEADSSEIYKLSQIDMIFASDDNLVKDIIIQLCNELKQILPKIEHIKKIFDLKGFDLNNLRPENIRLRDAMENHPGKILQTDMNFRQQQIFLSSNRFMMIQILTTEQEILSQSIVNGLNNNDVIISAQKWNRSTWSLSPMREIVLFGSMTIGQLSYQLCKFFNILDENNMLILTIKSYGKVLLSDLNSQIIKSIYRSWQSLLVQTSQYNGYYMNNNTTNHLNKKLSDISINYDLKFRTGELILVQDISEPLKELTPADMLSLHLVEDTGVSVDVSSMFPSYSTRYETYTGGIITQNYSNNSNNHNHSSGIKIKTQKDRDANKELDKQPYSEENRDPEVISPVLEDIVNSDEKEFQRQGGMALFADIADV